MNFKKLVMGGVAAAVLATSGVTATNAGEIEANVALSTDYIFRGFTQTNNDPAVSGGFDYSFDNGFYVGIWGSNVNFGSDTSTEIDLYGGYAVEIADGVEWILVISFSHTQVIQVTSTILNSQPQSHFMKT